MAMELMAAQQASQTLDKQLSEARETMEKYLRDYDTLFNRTQKLTEDLEHQVSLARNVSQGFSRFLTFERHFQYNRRSPLQQ